METDILSDDENREISLLYGTDQVGKKPKSHNACQTVITVNETITNKSTEDWMIKPVSELLEDISARTLELRTSYNPRSLSLIHRIPEEIKSEGRQLSYSLE